MWADNEDLSPILLEIAPEPDEVLLTEADLYQEAEDLYVSPARKKRKQGNLKITVLKHPNLTSQPPKKTGTLLALHPTLVSDQVSAATDGDADGDAPEDTFLDDEFSVSTSDTYSDFVERVKLGAVGFYQISQQGRRYHVEEVDDSQNIFKCTCGIDGKCVHERFVTEEGTEVFAGEINDYPEDRQAGWCNLILQIGHSRRGHNQYPVCCDTIQTRCLKRVTGLVAGKEDMLSVVHLRKIAGVEGLADDGEEAELDSDPVIDDSVPRSAAVRAVSHQLILPPVWAGLFEDPVFCCPLFVPPTTIAAAAPSHDSQYVYQQIAIVDPTLRKAVRPLVEGPALDEGGVDENVAEGSEGLDAEAEVEQAKSKREKMIAEAIELVELAPLVCISLIDLDIGLDPTENNVKQLLEIPAVYNVLRHEKSSAGEYLGNTMKMCNWLIARTTYVVSYLIDKGRKLETPGSMIQEQWEKSGCYYSMPPIRRRPQYPKLKHDQVHEGSK
ncbi:hypothetical protein DFH09DRAFT_1104463 [Mycena vulgaris]|nr:hypothetical protein DFH09DRAFT_1104458 [Mycena vulgaris]KAJ6493787.1 hypothetical protein DFH09DRAFT_1104463 [Mycena vulgaris]